MDLVEVLVEKDGDLEQRACGEPRDAHPAVSLQAEESTKTFLAAPGRAELDQEMRDFFPDVPQAVCRARRYDDDVAPARSVLSKP
jgi:hypothetical protein